MSNRIRTTVATVALLAPLVAVAFATTAAADDGYDHHHGSTIYTLTNAAAGNEVVAFRSDHGALTSVGSFGTGGLGSGNGLGSQGALVADDDHLLAVNAGSNQVSLFGINDDGTLTLGDVESSGGVRPVSVTLNGDVAYVVNVTDRTVSGFRIDGGDLQPIAGSTQPLPGNGAAQVSFDRNGRRLVVTEKATNTIDVLAVNGRGVAGAAVSNPSNGQTPFGFAIDRRNHVIVSNAAGGAAGASSVSSYGFAGRTTLSPLGAAVADTQSAACWIALSENERFAYTTNAASGTISSYRVARDGSLSLLDPVAASPGAGPLDMITADGNLFTLNGASHTITSHTVGDDGSLAANSTISVPTGVAGLATA